MVLKPKRAFHVRPWWHGKKFKIKHKKQIPWYMRMRMAKPKPGQCSKEKGVTGLIKAIKRNRNEDTPIRFTDFSKHPDAKNQQLLYNKDIEDLRFVIMLIMSEIKKQAYKRNTRI